MGSQPNGCADIDGFLLGELLIVGLKRVFRRFVLEELDELAQGDPLGLLAGALADRAGGMANVGRASGANGFTSRKVGFATAVLALGKDMDFDGHGFSLSRRGGTGHR